MSRIVEALAAVIATDRPRAAELLRVEWAAEPADDVAQALNRLVAGVVATRLPSKLNEADRAARWCELWAEADATAQAALTAMPWPKQEALAVKRAAALTARPSPLAAPGLAAICDDHSAYFYSTTPLFQALAACADATVAPFLTKMRRRWGHQTPEATLALERITMRATGQQPERSAADSDALREIVAVLDRAAVRATAQAPDLGALFAAVYDAPEDMSVRHVLADAAMQGGDPFGEFVSLQLADVSDRPLGRRESALLKEHEATWLKRLCPGSQLTQSPGEHRWRGGFPELVVSWFLPSHGPAWSTVRALSFSLLNRDAEVAAFLERPGCRNIAEVYGMNGLPGLRALLESPVAPRLKVIGLNTCDGKIDGSFPIDLTGISLPGTLKELRIAPTVQFAPRGLAVPRLMVAPPWYLRYHRNAMYTALATARRQGRSQTPDPGYFGARLVEWLELEDGPETVVLVELAKLPHKPTGWELTIRRGAVPTLAMRWLGGGTPLADLALADLRELQPGAARVELDFGRGLKAALIAEYSAEQARING